MELEQLLQKTEELLRRHEAIGRFSAKYSVSPIGELRKLFGELRELGESIPDIESPENYEGIIQAELKRRLIGEATNADHSFSGKATDFETAISLYGIPRSDVNALQPWLEANREPILEAIAVLFNSAEVKNYELPLPQDFPRYTRQAEGFVETHVERYHKRLGALIQTLTNVGSFLRDINALPSMNPRSYFSPITGTLAIGIPAVCYITEDGSLHIRERELIRLYGHEGMGHGLQHAVAQSMNLPYFLKNGSGMTLATDESVGQFYQRVIFEDLKNSPEAQHDLGIHHIFEDIYRDELSARLIEEYNLKLGLFSIAVMADGSLGDPADPRTLDRKIALISQYSIDPRYGFNFVQNQRHNFDSYGNLSPSLVGELRYCAQPVQRALAEFSRQGIEYDGNGRNQIDRTLLAGHWTPLGFVEHAKLRAQEK